MGLSRRRMLKATLAAPAIASFGPLGAARAAAPLRISHQFPGGTVEKGDFRDRLCRKFAQELEKRSQGELAAEVHPDATLVKATAQFSAMRRGKLEMSLYPLAYAGGEVVETNIGLMPCLVTSYEQGAAWKNAAVGRRLAQVLRDKGIVLVSWIWQAGGVASRDKPIIVPEDVRATRVRGGSREFDLMLKAAGAATLAIPSNESYAAMKSGACDAVVTSSTSLISFRLHDLAKSLTSGRTHSFWFMLEPLMMSKAVFDKLPKAQQDVIMQIGAELEPFGTDGAKADDIEVEKVFTQAGANVVAMDERALGRWRDVARETAWKDYAARSATCAELLKLAEEVS